MCPVFEADVERGQAVDGDGSNVIEMDGKALSELKRRLAGVLANAPPAATTEETSVAVPYQSIGGEDRSAEPLKEQTHAAGGSEQQGSQEGKQRLRRSGRCRGR